MTNTVERFKTLWPVREWKENGYFTDKDIGGINRHWLQFGPPENINFFYFWCDILHYHGMRCHGKFTGNMFVFQCIMFIFWNCLI
ncbi:hypothetical protein NQ318_020992 [Aromia moschata]|uniref:Uncharacterized protein n=1 Tax=Aromia moschata TaxID=1265417 RepID=A0AAV8YQ58_9CUCU|nr:hypothetical protein NQ318_020992 [Aromia moschata]